MYMYEYSKYLYVKKTNITLCPFIDSFGHLYILLN